MVQMWEVVGGGDKGGVLVREGESLSSKQSSSRLSTGALLEEVELKNDRLHFKRCSGTGPATGWISVRLPGKELAVKTDKRPDPTVVEFETSAPQASVENPTADTAMEAAEAGQAGPMREPPKWRRVDVPQIDFVAIKEVAAQNAPGDYYGIKFPHSKDQIVEWGTGWLTTAFHTTGVLSKTNAVTKIYDVKEFVGGGAGLKCTFKVEYKIDKPYLHKNLFAKLPHKPGGTDRFFVSCMWNHDRPEIIFNVFLQDTVPFRVPKFYFGDISAKTTNCILITESIEWSPKGKKEFKPGEIEPAYDKYKDWELPDGGPMYYVACCKALGKMAAYHKTGRLHSQVNEMFPMPDEQWDVQRGIPGVDPENRKMNAGKFDQMIRFLSETAKAVMPSEISDKVWLAQWKDEGMVVQDYGVEIDQFCRGAYHPRPHDYVGLTHNNLQIDNAFFWRDERNELEVGLLDWGVLGCGALINAIQGCISGAQVHVLVEHRDAFLQAFIDSYAENGGPRLDLDRLRLCSNLCMANWAVGCISNVTQVMKFTKAKEWTEIKHWEDPKLLERFQVRAHTTQFKESLQLWQKWDLFEEFKKFTSALELPPKKQ